MSKLTLKVLALCAMALCACSEDPEIPSGDQQGDPLPSKNYTGMFILNEGAYGQNNARLDYLDFETGNYYENLYDQANPGVVMGLGDIGNDLQLHQGRLYAVVNGSHKVEVMSASDAKRIGQVEVSSPRNIAFSNGKGYVTSWVDNGADNGSVVEFDLETLEVTRTVSVGQEPEGIAVLDGKLYVACSGGMHSPNYSSELWELSLPGLTVENKITVAPNLHRLQANGGALWVSARGNYADISSGLFKVEGGEVKALGVPCAGFALSPSKVYYYASEWSNATMSFAMAYGTFDRPSLTAGASFITDGTQADIAAPYGVFTDGESVFLTDAKNYVSSGALYVYGLDGKLQQTFKTGICPSSVAFVEKNK